MSLGISVVIPYVQNLDICIADCLHSLFAAHILPVNVFLCPVGGKGIFFLRKSLCPALYRENERLVDSCFLQYLSCL